MVDKAKKMPRNSHPVESLSETWWLSEVTPAIRKAFAATIRARARQQLIDDKPFLSEEDYAAEREALQDRIDAVAYDWGPPLEIGGTGAGKAIRAALASDEGILGLIQMLLSESHGDVSLTRVTEIVNGNPEGVQSALRAAQGLSPLPVAPPQQEAGQSQESTPETTSTPMPNAIAS